MAALIDSHCHLDFAAFDEDRAEMLMRAHQVGVTHFVVPGVTQKQWPRLRELQKRYQNWHIAFGLHPYFIEQHEENHLEMLSQQLHEGGAVAVGEIGLDATCPDISKQKELLKAQLKLAAEFELPVILHHRKTLDEMLKMVKQAGIEHGVVHAFSGSQQQAEHWIEQGFKLGVGGVITYDRANKTRTTISKVPLQSLLLETDSPDMPMCGKQGERNEPAYITRALDALYELREEPRDQVRAALWQNTLQLFKIG
ncbi:TatD family deoxyribonuclease [Aliidiomarina minuta]|uniref:TatD family deoxyribonuclease n=1 Tax=Aliidiomarina minuta TaxID=880057 RepID=A0A432W824_9GAMM|nr:TatD family hydrolase [Aliidiomarina minuta]RUO26234.1 TatD family deoxyribonuclease [Aliidiomarina minuta]